MELDSYQPSGAYNFKTVHTFTRKPVLLCLKYMPLYITPRSHLTTRTITILRLF
jgi:hypothetical protein